VGAAELEEGGEAPGQSGKLALLAGFVAGPDAVDAAVEQAAAAVADVRATGIGWGALFKLYQYAAILDVPVGSLIGEPNADGELELSLGELKKMIDPDQWADYDGPKNFGQLNSASKKAAKAKGPKAKNKG
jgi:hypothetical protein